MIKITTKEFCEKGENFQQKFNTALKDGFFYAEIPDSIKNKIQSVVEYTSQLRENDTLKQMDLGERLGYQERHGTQAVAFTAPKPSQELHHAEPAEGHNRTS